MVGTLQFSFIAKKIVIMFVINKNHKEVSLIIFVRGRVLLLSMFLNKVIICFFEVFVGIFLGNSYVVEVLDSYEVNGKISLKINLV